MRVLGAQGDPHARRRARHAAWCARRRSSPRSTAGSSPASSRTRPTRPTTAARPARRSCIDFAGKRLDYFVTGWGTGGTLTGAGEMIRLARPEVQIIATEPAGASLLAGKPWAAAQDPGLDAGLRARGAESAKSRTRSSPVHGRRGARHRAGPGDEGRHLLRHLVRRHVRGGAARSQPRRAAGSVILAMLPDTGERYLSTLLFEGINEGADPEP